MKILYFAHLGQLIGKRNETIKLKKKTKISSLISQLKKKDKKYKHAFESIKNFKCAINCEYAELESYVKDEDEVAFFPPVTGG